MSATLEQNGPQASALAGDLNFANVPALWTQIDAIEFGRDTQVVNLAAVEAVDSAGLAMLVQWWRKLSESGARLQLENCPDSLLALARLTDLDEVLELSTQVV